MLKTTRHKIEMQYENTDNIKSKIESCQYLKQQFHGNRVSRYLIDYKGYPIEIRVMPAKAINTQTEITVAIQPTSLIPRRLIRVNKMMIPALIR